MKAGLCPRWATVIVSAGALAAAMLATGPAQAAAVAPHGPSAPVSAGHSRQLPHHPMVITHRLTPAQISERGLTKYVPRVANGGCWNDTFYWTNTATAWLGTSEVWCGNGASEITYAEPGNCFGGTRYPTYNYLGCSRSAFYGAGWTIAQQEATWQFCLVWLPWPVSTCLDQESPTLLITMHPNGSYSF
jgi:hypothetical protein